MSQSPTKHTFDAKAVVRELNRRSPAPPNLEKKLTQTLTTLELDTSEKVKDLLNQLVKGRKGVRDDNNS